MSGEKIFQDRFRQFYTSKGYKSCYEISLSSEELYGKDISISQSYLSHLVKKPILNPRKDTIEKLARVFAKKSYLKEYGPLKHGNNIDEEKMKILVDQEYREIENFFMQAREEIKKTETSVLSKEMKDMKEVIWKITLVADIEDWSKISLDIMAKLEEQGNGMILVKEFRQGSIILVLESSPSVFQRIQSLYQAGQLDNLLGLTVLDLQILPNQEYVNLSQWFEGILSDGWQIVEDLLTPQQLMPAVWSDRTKGARLFDIRVNFVNHAVILVINLTREDENKTIVWLQVYPSQEEYLPPNLKLSVLVDDEIFDEVIARSADVLMQCQFDASVGDQFTIKISLGDIAVTEKFMV